MGAQKGCNNKGTVDKAGKKTFNKKKWRERTYSNKFKVEKWEEKRRRSIIREYHKDLKSMGVTSSNPAFQANKNEPQQKKKKLSAMEKARLIAEQQKEEKRQRQLQREQQKAEKEEALKQYRIRKAEKFKKLSKKTKKGQPVMKDRLELLLEKIQKQCAQDK